MTELNQSDRKNVRRREVSGSRTKRGLFVRLGLLALMMSIALGNRSCIDDRAANIACMDSPVRVEAGTCTTFQNPCDDHQWLPAFLPEGFRLEPDTEEQRVFIAAHQLSLRATRVGDETTRELCAGPIAPLGQHSLPYKYVRRNGYGVADLVVTVAPALTLTATASPSGIAGGQSSQLVAHVSGGIPPYFYVWSPSPTLDDNDIAAPIATPGWTTTYTVGVTDSGGQNEVRTVTVFVDFNLRVTANPDLIDAGDPSQLDAIAVGGLPPYTYSWTPTVGLDDPLRADPVATPTTTTIYTAQVTDAAGATRQGSATVHIRDSLPLTASFVYNIQCCPTVDLDASASTGNIVSYTWDLSWTAANPDRVTTSPLTSFPFNEIDRGTITLTVTSANGNTATTTRGFPFPGPAANGHSSKRAR
ncbi:MAG: hypothetical protein ND895_01760 [Pyrinomonadaceae bacterium]|nr:hypothetical protein [Pyrinomonadaceae bacterium]